MNSRTEFSMVSSFGLLVMSLLLSDGSKWRAPLRRCLSHRRSNLEGHVLPDSKTPASTMLMIRMGIGRAVSAETTAIAEGSASLRIEAREQHDNGTRYRRIGPAADRGGPLPVDDIVRGIEEGVDPSAPWKSAATGDRRELELERLPRPLQRRIALPVVRGDVDDDAHHRRPGVVARAPRGVATIGPWNNDAPAVGVQENL